MYSPMMYFGGSVRVSERRTGGDRSSGSIRGPLRTSRDERPSVGGGGLKPGMKMAVAGLGGLGAMAVLIGKAMGAEAGGWGVGW